MKYLSILLTVFVLALVIGANIYTPRKIAKYLGIEKTWILYIVFAFVTVSFIVSSRLVNSISNELVKFYYISSTILFSIYFYLFLTIILFGILNLLLKIPDNINGVIISVLTIIVSGFSFWNALTLNTSYIDIEINGIGKEIRIMHLSDIHLGIFRGEDFLSKIVDKTNELDPELVFITGDLVDSNVENLEKMLSPLKELNSNVFFTTGNHDHYVGIENIISILSDYGITTLRNEIVTVHEIQIIGLDYMDADHESFNMHPGENDLTVMDVLPRLDISEEIPSILLHHSPVGMKYVNQAKIDLLLSGHTHGGQFFPVNLVNSLIFHYNKGLYEYNGTQVYVSQGAGTFFMPMRLGTQNEITLISLKASN